MLYMNGSFNLLNIEDRKNNTHFLAYRHGAYKLTRLTSNVLVLQGLAKP
jgi:hypothetical protein